MLQHHRCAPRLSPPQLYEELIKMHCDEILSEQNAIRSLALGLGKYQDLYLEQGMPRSTIFPDITIMMYGSYHLWTGWI